MLPLFKIHFPKIIYAKDIHFTVLAKTNPLSLPLTMLFVVDCGEM